MMKVCFGVFLIGVAALLAGINLTTGIHFVDDCPDYVGFPVLLLTSGTSYFMIAVLMLGTIRQMDCYGCLVAMFIFIHFALHIIESVSTYLLWCWRRREETSSSILRGSDIVTETDSITGNDVVAVICSRRLIFFAFILVTVGWIFIIMTACWLWAMRSRSQSKKTSRKLKRPVKTTNILTYCVHNSGKWIRGIDQGKQPLITDV